MSRTPGILLKERYYLDTAGGANDVLDVDDDSWWRNRVSRFELR